MASFDSVSHDLLLKAVAHHTQERWVLLYIERWLKAPMRMPDGTVVARERGTPQGAPISSLLANLFMNYAFDRWMVRKYPGCPFERYADDIVVHCNTEMQARRLWADVAKRLKSLGLSYTLRRRRSCTAKTRTVRATRSTPASTTWATPSGDVRRMVREATL